MGVENDHFKLIRTNRGLTQEDFAAKLEISAPMVRKIEQGHSNVSLSNAKKIREVFGVSMDYIYGFTEDTDDDASTMLLYLTKLFDYKEPHHSLSIKKCVADFLNNYAQAKDMFERGIIPVAAYEPWVDKLKHDFNNAIIDVEDVAVEFCLVPKEEFDKFMEFKNRDFTDSTRNALIDMGIKFSSKAAEQRIISQIIEQGLSDDSLSSFIKAQKEADPDAFAPDKPAPRFLTGGGGHGEPPESVPARAKGGLLGRGRNS